MEFDQPFVPVSSRERIRTWIGPDIGPIPTILPQLDIVAMGSSDLLKDKDQLMLRPIQTPHSTGAFVPNAKRFKLLIYLRASRREFGQMPPVHTDVVQRP